MTRHTSKEFEQELTTVRDRLVAMGRQADQQITDAMRALTEQDDVLAQGVVRADDALDRAELEIDELCQIMLATRQPVASDLRFITMSMKFVTDLERIGDLAVGIAKRCLELNRLPSFQLNNSLARLAQMVQVNLRAALEAFIAKDAERATAVIAADVEIDRLNASLFAELIAHVVTDPANVTRVLPLTSVCRYLERIGDHVKNLAEEIVYMVRARDVRHRAVRSSS
ncbi:MAG: phosphate signaling complex protein PhoU [Kofleriaceae bacterium]